MGTLRHFIAPGSWTLRAKLVASTVLLFLIVSIASSTLIVLATQRYLTSQIDSDVRNLADRNDDRNNDRDGDGRRGDLNGGPVGAPPGGGSAVLMLAIKDGAIATYASGRPINTVVTVNNQVTTLTDAQVATLQNAGLGDHPKTINLGAGVGHYRLISLSRAGTTTITGLPTAAITNTTKQLLGLVSGGTLLGLGAVGLGGTYLVRRNLEPLERVAATARRVSHLKLDSGDVALAERIAARDTDAHTEVGQVGLALNSMLDNVDGALRARQESEMRVRQFVADASHELRTPLASIRGYAELSRKEPQPVPANVTHALGRVESEALRMQGLVEDLLLLARLDAGRPLERSPVDLTLLAIDAISDARAASPAHKWELALPDEPVEVPGDQARLHQVLANLLANARSHTPPGTRVVLSLARSGDTVTMAVTDNGPGVPESLQPNVFERFSRGDEARTRVTGSTGLGLSIVAAVSAAHGGRVGVEAKPGHTRFLVELPAT